MSSDNDFVTGITVRTVCTLVRIPDPRGDRCWWIATVTDLDTKERAHGTDPNCIGAAINMAFTMLNMGKN